MVPIATTSAVAATPAVASLPPCTVSVPVSPAQEMPSLTVPPPAAYSNVHNTEPVQPPSAASVQPLPSGCPAGTFINPTHSNVNITVVNSLQAFHQGRLTIPEAQVSSQVTAATPSSERPTSSNSPSTSMVTQTPTPPSSAQRRSNGDTSSGNDIGTIKWRALASRFGDDHLRRHSGWSFKDGEWLPIYHFQSLTCITDIWVKYADGLGGHLPVQFMNKVWGAKWKRNIQTIKMMASRRMRVIELILKLEKKPRWDLSLALRFLREKYEPQYTVCNFSSQCEGKKGITFVAQVLAAADSYPS